MAVDASIIQFRDRSNDSSVYPITKQSAVLDASANQDLTTYITEYNISLHQVNKTANSPRYDTSIFTLEEAIAQVPAEYKHGGLKLTFISNDSSTNVQSSDNKYVQYRLTADDWSTDTDDWAITDEGVYVENPEYVYVKTDAKGKILLAIKVDGSIYFGAGVPQQITILLNSKVDKIENKSLIDEDFATSQSSDTNLEWMNITADDDNKILEGISKDGIKKIKIPTILNDVTIKGNITFTNGVPAQVQEQIQLLLLPNIIQAVNRTLTYGKDIAIIGDSISTFDGYHNYYDYMQAYPNETYGCTELTETYWYKLIDYLGANITLNMSMGGSGASHYQWEDEGIRQIPSLYERTLLIGTPTTVIVALGTNDSAYNNLGDYCYDTPIEDITSNAFIPQYTKGIKYLVEELKIKNIICLILYMHNTGFAEAITNIANHYNLAVIDCRGYHCLPVAGPHPDTEGMNDIYNTIVTELGNYKLFKNK